MCCAVDNCVQGTAFFFHKVRGECPDWLIDQEFCSFIYVSYTLAFCRSSFVVLCQDSCRNYSGKRLSSD